MSRRILLADDSVTIQKVIELTFMDDDYEVRAVGNGDEALAMLTALHVDFVIADVHMPGASGYEVCRRSKQQRPEVPVLLLVGTFEPFDESQARACGADSFLKKPFDSQELLGRVHDLLGPTAEAPAAAAPAAESPEAAADAAPHAAPMGAVAAAAVPAAAEIRAGDEPVGGVRTVEAAGSWQEFELEAEPELIPEPWHAPHAPQPAAPAPAALGSEPLDHSFALGDLDDHEIVAGHEAAAGFEPAAPAAATPTPGSPPAVSGHQPFTMGEPLDDHSFLLDQEEDTASPAPSSREGRATQAEPVSPFFSAGPGSASPPRREETGAGPGQSAEVAAERAEPAEHAAAAAAPETGFAFAANPTSIYSPASSPSPSAAASGAGATEVPFTAAGAGHPAGPAEGNGRDRYDLEAGQPLVAPSTAAQPLGDEDVDRIARRVVELIGDKVVRDIAWEVIPDLAEVVIKDRLRELESQIE